MENEKLEISAKYLEDCINASSSKLVGEVMRKFETLSKQEEIKQAVKDCVYENFRDMKAQIRAFNYGVKFISTPKPDKKG